MVFDRGGSNRSRKPFIPRLVKRQFSHCSSSMTFYSVCSLPPSSAVASRLAPLLLFFSPLVSPSVTEILWWLYFVILVSFSILDPPSTHGGQSCFETWWFFAFLSNSGCWCLQQSPNCFLPMLVVSWVCPAWPCTCQGSQVKINTLGSILFVSSRTLGVDIFNSLETVFSPGQKCPEFVQQCWWRPCTCQGSQRRRSPWPCRSYCERVAIEFTFQQVHAFPKKLSASLIFCLVQQSPLEIIIIQL